ncbi:isochorismatase family protein [Chitinophaga oryziterrae]|uniref:Isochorismatase family protein n=1 Tax=Chitinophaga oryziterrae TaxID=1031224 RepID=A0A6N8J541_9BACT|nr:isochorismatase family protein [Chitinophaga oryziterrae]MVT40300.1 isochorismatase family protein [Chitinophaga oryziterrae]
MDRHLSLSPGNHSLLLIDYQYLQLLTIRSHATAAVISHVIALSKASRIFGSPALLTTAFAEQQDLLGDIAQVFPEQVPLDRNTMNAMEDPSVAEWVERSGKKKVVMAGLWTEVCLQLSVLKALEAGYEVYVITDASGGASLEEHQKAIECMAEAGAKPLTTWSYINELQRNWDKEDTTGALTKLLEEYDPLGTGFRWGGQLRNYLFSRKLEDCYH